MLPILYNSKNFIFYTYPLMMGIAWAFGSLITLNLIKQNNSKIVKPKLLLTLVFMSSWIGAKLLFILLSQNNKIIAAEHFWLGGGFIFYGGLIAGCIAVFSYFKYQKINFDELKFLIPGLILGHGVGRIGCFFAGCCYGVNHLPTQLIEAIFLIGLGVYFLKNFYSIKNLAMTYLLTYSIFRFVIEFLRDDPVRGMVYSVSTSQLIALVFVLYCLILLKIKKL